MTLPDVIVNHVINETGIRMYYLFFSSAVRPVFFIIVMVYLLTALAAKQGEKVHLQVKIVCLKKYFILQTSIDRLVWLYKIFFMWVTLNTDNSVIELSKY